MTRTGHRDENSRAPTKAQASFALTAMVVMAVTFIGLCSLTASTVIAGIVAIAMTVPVVLYFGGALRVTRSVIDVGRRPSARATAEQDRGKPTRRASLRSRGARRPAAHGH